MSKHVWMIEYMKGFCFAIFPLCPVQWVLGYISMIAFIGFRTKITIFLNLPLVDWRRRRLAVSGAPLRVAPRPPVRGASCQRPGTHGNSPRGYKSEI